jgi:hypothetical protein
MVNSNMVNLNTDNSNTVSNKEVAITLQLLR